MSGFGFVGRRWRGLIIAVAVLFAAGEARGQQAQEPPCADEAHHQFDFWVGTWEVTNAQGQVVGTNEISSILGGCVLLEEWQSAGPYSGKSLNIYDAANDKWHQTWVDNGGLLLELDGKLVDGNMVMKGRRPGQDGTEVLHRITWAPLEDGDVRQTWDTSADDGGTWTTLFNGLYTPKE